ncbi:MAG: hypothetical protein ACKOPC_00785 [Methylocystis sp.]
MKKILLSAVSLAILSGSALAADLPSRKAPVAPPPPPPPMWTGFYAGLNLGGGGGATGALREGRSAASAEPERMASETAERRIFFM